VLTGLSGYINVLALLSAVVGLPLFAGTKRESIFDRDNVIGLLLVGFALLVHGGFGTLLRSSPHVTFDGYVLGWDGGHDGRRFWIYDLAHPNEFPWDASSRGLHLESTKSNPVPDSFWTIDKRYLMKVDYRLWDLEVTSIDALPVPELQAKGLSSWHWQSHAEARCWLILQTIIGVVFVVAASIVFIRKIGFNRKYPLRLSG
jgi:hypothetical protein